MAGMSEKIGDLKNEIEVLEGENRELRETIRYLSDRKNNDLDSIELGAPSKGGRVKVYFNSRAESVLIKEQIDEALAAMGYIKAKTEEVE